MNRIIAKIKNIINRIFYKTVKPDFIIIGAQKGGTTSLHYYLNQHPNLKGSIPKELHYFDRKLENRESLAWYLSHFKKNRFKNKLLFETTPSYIYHENIAKELIELNPNIKLIVILRNPIDRAYSAWNMYKNFYTENKGKIFLNIGTKSSKFIYENLYKDKKEFLSFEKMIEFEKELIKNNVSKEPAVLRRGLYFKQIIDYQEHISKENMLILESDSLKNNTINTINNICNFLQIKTISENNINIEKKHRRKYNTRISNETRKYLQDFYKDSNERLYELLEKNLNWK